jgi:hypothetical protein
VRAWFVVVTGLFDLSACTTGEGSGEVHSDRLFVDGC